MSSERFQRRRSLNVRLRLALACALFAAPLVLSLSLAGELVLRQFEFNARELHDVGRLTADWASLPAGKLADPATAARLRARLGSALILDDRPDAYRLAEALNADLLDLAVGEAASDAETARFARNAASELSAAAADLGIDALGARLASRADELRTTVRPTAAQARQWWSETLADLGEVLAARRQRMLWTSGLALLVVVASAIAGGLIAGSIARGLTRRVGGLTDEIERLIRRDTHGVTPYLDDAHEIGRIAKGVEALRQALMESRGAWGEVLANEMRYSLLAENMREVLLLTDREGRIVFASPSAAKLGFDPEALEGVSALDIFAPAAGGELKRGLAQAGDQPRDLPGLRLARAKTAWDVTVTRPPEQDENLVLLMTPAIQPAI